MPHGITFADLPGKVGNLATAPEYKPVFASAGVSLDDLERARVWTEVLRLALNAVHHGVDDGPSATWETTAGLLMALGVHLRALTRLAAAAAAAR